MMPGTLLLLRSWYGETLSSLDFMAEMLDTMYVHRRCGRDAFGAKDYVAAMKEITLLPDKETFERLRQYYRAGYSEHWRPSSTISWRKILDGVKCQTTSTSRGRSASGAGLQSCVSGYFQKFSTRFSANEISLDA
jgi:hypothetical protein